MEQRTTLIVLIAVVGSAALMLVFFLLRGLFERRRQHWDRRLNGSTGSSPELQLEPEKPGAMRRMDSAFDDMIARTGLEWSSADALGVMCMAGVALAGLLFYFRPELWAVVLGLLAGMGLVLFVFLILQRRYRLKLQEQMPDAFYLLARSLRAGMSLEQALSVSAEQGARPLADQFRRAVRQIELGLPVEVALENMGRRIRLIDFNAFVSTVSLYRTTGGNLPLLLDRLAQQSRDRAQFRGYLRAATAMGRVTAIFLACVVPALLLGYAIFQPEHVHNFFASTTGWTMVALALGLQLIGFFWLYRLLKIDY